MLNFSIVVFESSPIGRSLVKFRDITPLLRDSEAFRRLIDTFCRALADVQIDVIAGIDARRFIIGAALDYTLGCSFIPVRKAGKLPFGTKCESYSLEYGE
jgi:adenine phosphoribosyltransferase